MRAYLLPLPVLPRITEATRMSSGFWRVSVMAEWGTPQSIYISTEDVDAGESVTDRAWKEVSQRLREDLGV